jgi:hypothetical protein
MTNRRLLSLLLFLTSFCSSLLGAPTGPPAVVWELVRSADRSARLEYCGAVSTSKADFYLFLLERQALAGLVLVQEQTGAPPIIFQADTSLFFRSYDDRGHSLDRPLQDGIRVLLQKRNAKDPGVSPPPTRGDAEISAVGREIDRIIYPIASLRLGSNSTQEIWRLLRTGPTVAVDARSAPPGSIIVSPTRYFPHGPVYLGHAGIVGLDGSIYSADARFGGRRTKNFSLADWLKQFGSSNGCFAFVVHVPPGREIPRL